ncbi:uncharacterized protein A4U43_C03F22210 [Asparagus officinalis]|uniref:Protein kinase domain-containing protein n=1 Tax=Asparagus officinalis TaxID=4686 RepID=A0A5P1FD16_ASPOF|nr:protein STRUBBELIG-RECEPTOR FAMILY 3-like isoform X2 [Asparagus officinalis]ONK75944.1 uncharacterized protein A4U43_C03F22210 [Asparagus officinalis]
MNEARLSFLSAAVFGLVAIFAVSFCEGFTNEQDVHAINILYAALGTPLLPGWVQSGGDPCLEAWQGVQCTESNITAITINGANLGGELGDALGNFTSITTIDLSNNNIGGTIPENLPLTLKTFFLSANQLTGSIPSSLSKLTLLSDMSVNVNHLSGDLPDAFQSLTGLINFDLSSNNLSGQLPPSMENLSSLTTLHIQNNQFSGTLDVLQDLPIKDLNIENNLFSGPIPEKLMSIPNFKKDGNPFNSTNSTGIAPSPVPRVPPSGLPPPFFPRASPPKSASSNSSQAPPSQKSHNGKNGTLSTIKIFAFVLVGVISLIVIVLTVIFCISKYQEKKSRHPETSTRTEVISRERPKEPRSYERPTKPNTNVNKVQNASEEQNNEHKIDMGGAVPVVVPENKKKDHLIDRRDSEILQVPPRPPEKKKEHFIDRTDSEILSIPPPPPPPPLVEKVIVNRIPPSEPITLTASPATANTLPSVASYSVASLQQYTNSFSEENLIRDGRLGKVFLAELPDGKLLTVMKLDNVNSKISVDEFLELVLSISELRHPNIVELVGYCAEFGQRLLVYNFFSRKTLHDVLHYEDDLREKLSWNARLQVALGAARALEYLHEVCQPPTVHQEFGPNNILINDKFTVRVSDCGLAPLLSSSSVTQLSGRMRALFSYEAPEFNESGSYSDRSDVYSFGVVMLELLTGREPYDSSRPRAEQHLVRWASSQLHDINNLSRMVDPQIGGKCPKKSLSQFADIISRCIQHGPEFRPPISEVVQDLNQMVEDSKRVVAEASNVKSQRTRQERRDRDSD